MVERKRLKPKEPAPAVVVKKPEPVIAPCLISGRWVSDGNGRVFRVRFTDGKTVMTTNASSMLSSDVERAMNFCIAAKRLVAA